MKNTLLLLAVALAPLAVACAQDITDTITPGNLTPTQQVAGDLTQVYNWNQGSPANYGQVSQALSESAAVGSGNMGVWGLDEGACALVNAKQDIWCFSGDVDSTYWATSPQTGWQMFSRQSNTCGLLGSISGGSGTCLALKAVWVIQNQSGVLPDPSSCGALPGVMSSLVASHTNTPLISYTGCNPIKFVGNTSHTAASQPMFSTVSVTQSTGTTTDKAGNGLTIVAGREFLACANVTIAGVDTLLCAVSESRINGASGNTWYLGATVFQQVPVSSLYSGGVANFSRTTEIPFAASYTSASHAFAVLSNAPPITTCTTATITQTNTAPYTYTVVCGSSVFLPGMANTALMESSPNGSNSNDGLITGYTSGTSVTVKLAGGSGVSNPWTTGSGKTITVQPAPYDMATPNRAVGQNVGKFLVPSMYYISAANLATWPWTPYLPLALRNAPDGIVLIWGAAQYGKSNLYMGAMDVDLIASSGYTYTTSGATTTGGLNSMWYVTGMSAQGFPSWTQGSESSAIPLLSSWNHVQSGDAYTSECVNEHSVEWSPGLGRWLTTYGYADCGNYMARTSLAPWGPFSTETKVMTSALQTSLNTGNYNTSWQTLLTWNNSGSQPGFTDLNDYPAANTPTCSLCKGSTATPVAYEGSTLGSTISSGPWTNTGAGYGFMLSPGQEHINADGSVTRAAHFSTLSPYTVFDALVTFSSPPDAKIVGPTVMVGPAVVPQ